MRYTDIALEAVTAHSYAQKRRTTMQARTEDRATYRVTTTALDEDHIIAEALEEPFHGLVINPAGPWIGLDHDELRAIQSRLPA